jgi:MFS family permease
MQDDAVYKLTLGQRALVVLTIVLSTTIYAGSVLISSALLPQLQGALSATQDEVSWVMTFNIVATAVATPMTGWLADRLGARATMIWSALLFAVSTFMCGASNSLQELIFWRIVQGAAGAPLVPLGQTILLDSSPRSQHAAVMSIFGMSNMIGPSLGPMFAGQIAETLGWRWGFWMIVPVAVAAVIGSWLALPRTEGKRATRLDWLGFISLSAGIAAGQLVFSRGQRLDWFESTEIILATFVGCLMLYVFCMHSLTTERPFVRLKLLADRNYALGLILVTLFGMLNFALIVLLPPLLQQHAGYPESAIGEIIGARGIGSAIGFLLAMPMARLDPACQPVHRRAGARRHRLVADEPRPQRRHDDADAVQHPAGRIDRRVVGAADRHHLLDAVARVPRRGHVGVPSFPQLRLEPVHLHCGCRDRAHAGYQLRALGRARLALQSRAGDAVGDGRLECRHGRRPRQAVGRDRPSVHHDRLHQRLAALCPGGAGLAAVVPIGAVTEGGGAVRLTTVSAIAVLVQK